LRLAYLAESAKRVESRGGKVVKVSGEQPTWMPGWRLRDLMVRKELSPVEVTQHFLDRIDNVDPAIHAFITVAPELALDQARMAEESLASGTEPGPLFGLPISLKDNYWTHDIRTTAGSLLYKDHVPPEDSVYAERARRAGAIIVGKTNLPEFALFPRTVNRLVAECLNPWDLERTSGGSSGGAAASIAAGLTPLAIGSDGGGSIRIPAALCGVFGLHPSNGRVPRHGGMGGTLFLSGVGPITHDVRDAAALFQVLAGPDPRDPSCTKGAPPDYLESLEAGVEGLKFLWVSDYGDVGEPDQRVVEVASKAAASLEELGARVEQSRKGFAAEEWMDAFYTIMNADRYAQIGQQIYENPSARGLLSDYGRDHFSRARGITAVEYSRALQTRFRVVDYMHRMFDDNDLLLSPTVGILAPSLAGPIVRRPLVAYTFIVNYSGFTASTVPCGFVDGLPVGLQVIGRPNHEATVLRASRALEKMQPWARPREVGPVA
jgi:Asp-tRNA(Asn)/Glu-tRNA(Gln) amidotransferase A subunit family amidase